MLAGFAMSTATDRVLLITDVVDSTRLVERLGDAAAAALWTAHDRAARDLLPPWRGREIDKTDGLLLMFESVADAVHYARAYLAALARLEPPLSARAGLHLGPVLLRENTAADIARGAKPLEVDGLAKPAAARVMALAHGGQLLLTRDATLRLCAECGVPAPQAQGGPADVALGSGLQLRSHGPWMLKGIEQPWEIDEVADAGSAFEPPQDVDKAWRVVPAGDGWRAAREIANNLPQPGSSFIGRQAERARLRELLGQARLVTLLGMGGLGKTRLSVQVALEQLHGFPDGAWFIDLSVIQDPSLVAAEAAQALGLRAAPDRPLLETLSEHLRSRCTLLILDNCEHLVQAAASLAHALLRAAPRLRILASSREALRVPGEAVLPIPPMPLPLPGASAAALQDNPAVRLFIERARQHQGSFDPDATTTAAVAELVTRLEGIPLALELAAARVRVLSVAEINLRLRDRYRLLTGGSRVLQQRQQTLRALVDWSYDMLAPGEQVLLQRLGVFIGGFDLGAVEAVCAAEPLDPLDMLDLLAALADKSLLLAEPDGSGGTRYRMLDTLREYAREKLQATGGLPGTAAAHAAHYFGLAKAGRQGLMGPQQAQWVARLEAEHENLRAAAALALAGGTDPFIAVKMAVALQGFWILRGYVPEGRALVDAALALPAVQAAPMAQAHALYVGAALAGVSGDSALAQRLLTDCLTLRRQLGHPVEVAATLSTRALARLQAGDTEGALADEGEALALFTAAGDRVGMAIGRLHLGQFQRALGCSDAARSHFGAALELALAIGHREVQAEAELGLGDCHFDDGDAVAAQAAWQRALAVAREAGDRRGATLAAHAMGRAALHARRLDEAQTLLGQAAADCRAQDMHAVLLDVLDDLVRLAAAQGRHAQALQAAGAADRQRRREALPRLPAAQVRWEGEVQVLRRRAGEAIAADVSEVDATSDLGVLAALSAPVSAA